MWGTTSYALCIICNTVYAPGELFVVFFWPRTPKLWGTINNTHVHGKNPSGPRLGGGRLCWLGPHHYFCSDDPICVYVDRTASILVSTHVAMHMFFPDTRNAAVVIDTMACMSPQQKVGSPSAVVIVLMPSYDTRVAPWLNIFVMSRSGGSERFDSAWEACLKILNNVDSSDWESRRPELLECYRTTYRKWEEAFSFRHFCFLRVVQKVRGGVFFSFFFLFFFLTCDTENKERRFLFQRVMPKSDKRRFL